ncbi:type II toxin-antitoxin system HicB family antitoxin [Chromatium okenii]|jgi:predicted RNase H-like HicB family nuclease|uniref:HicB family protein n=1 Tax=Chromatium okenii TaxID=61644 RepID=A0A2S7XNC4_9GAMM|nr:type II toxin-antitoxin system HicB family antitoxin [Chromatium okenii]MBV5308561.1 type II toxin-antitoxin system HicB family antitoxin [Chromatium okenii]PQJ95239.1 HicB family protein [Chromatium okenii]
MSSTPEIETKKEFSMGVERDAQGIFIGSVIGLRGCYVQAESIELLRERAQEAIKLHIAWEDRGEDDETFEFLGMTKVFIEA